MLRKLLFFCALVSFPSWAIAAEGLIWVEAENAVKKTLVPNGAMENVNPDALSGGKWICGWSHLNLGEPAGFAEYAVEIPAAGKYHVWARGIPGSGLAYRVDGAKDAVEVAVDKGQDPTPISADANPFWPGTASWFDAGTVELSRGKHTLTWYLGGTRNDKDRYGGLDCFVLTTGTFVPNGKYKPGEKSPQPQLAFQPGQTWDFQPKKDTFDPAAVLDLRGLNEQTAGEHGFIKRSTNGDSFVRGDGQPVRFWAAGLRTGQHDMKELRREARFLAKHGVNAIRVFAMLPPTDPNSKITDVNEADLDSLFMTEAAMKAEGIYTFTGAYWPCATQIQKNWDVTNPGRTACDALVYFDPKFQVGYKAWMEALCTRKNPYTGLRIADDPAVAVIQLQNEDCLLWWGIMGLQGDAQKLLLRQYADFLIRKHGSLEKTRALWQNYKGVHMLGSDDWAAGLPGMLNVYDMSRAVGLLYANRPGFKTRIADQTEFLARLSRRFNADMIQYLRGLGCKQLINAGNWRTVDLVTTQDAEYWADGVADVLARNIYTGGIHQGGGNGWLIVPGHVYSDVSMLTSPLQMPLNTKQPVGHPIILTEVLWCPPNLYQSEAALLVAARQALCGMGAECWFCNGVEPDWQQDPRTKWTYSTPMQIGQFPAAALLYRRGLVRQGSPAVTEHRSLQDLWQCKIPLVGEEPGWDPNRDQGNMPRSPNIKTVVDPLAYWVGPVREVYGSDPAKSTAVDLSKYIDRQAKTVRSITGEMELDYGRGIFRVNAPAAQAACGFLAGAGEQRLADVSIDCRNRYASIVVVPLDGQPIAKSAKLLVQAGTLARPTGWCAVPFRARLTDGKQGDCFRIVDNGKMPFQVEKLDASVTIANPKLRKATLLDVNGMATATPVEVKRVGGKLLVVLPADTIYVVLE